LEEHHRNAGVVSDDCPDCQLVHRRWHEPDKGG
jgi:hypothetical protein